MLISFATVRRCLRIHGNARMPAQAVRGLATRWPSRRRNKGERAVSLLEELFPQETRSHNPKISAKKPHKRNIPRIALDVTIIPEDESFTQDVESEHAPVPAPLPTSSRYTNSSVLVLRSASKSLSEDDFRRCAPTSTHISGWRSNSDLLKGNLSFTELYQCAKA